LCTIIPVSWQRVLAAPIALTYILAQPAFPQPAPSGDTGATYDEVIPPALRGPFISDPAIIAELDCPNGQCGGPLDFARLMLARAATVNSKVRPTGNPFNLAVASMLRRTIESDLAELAKNDPDVADHQLKKAFLTDKDSRVELVGAVNRMDRQFIKDTSQGLTRDQLACGEVSLIYRFSYSLTDRVQKSRLPVTLNMVFPALPTDTRGATITCKVMAQRWLAAIRNIDTRHPAKAAADLLDPNSGPLALITGPDMVRLELNMQAYRKPASIARDFGTEAAYLIRVFKWLPDKGYFDPDVLRNQIDRAKVLCEPPTPEKCATNRRRRSGLVAFLSRQDTLESLDKGTLEIDYSLKVLATRGISISPGGAHRSNNQPYWNASSDDEQIISNAEIERALAAARRNKVQLSFIKTKEDFRARLNDSTCTGCHQTRAIAGFHFPGADRAGTSAVNSVLLPGSPHFYGDQPRRLEIVEKIANGPARKLTEYELATSYAARPMNRFRSVLASTQMIGGWGGTCLVEPVLGTSQRQWTCQDGLDCVQLFHSRNSPGIGTCVPKAEKQVGDALQAGTVTTAAFGRDRYMRTAPAPIVGDDTRVPRSGLPSNPPPGNSYYGAHQEYYEGNPSSSDKDERRDAKTGGFPSGMLRLSECLHLPDHATCGLIASSGFNDCIGKLETDSRYTIDVCFTHFTSYAGLRACAAGSPCRDDYICVKPMGYTPATAEAAFEQRKHTLINSKFFSEIVGSPYRSENYYGQQMPDAAWIKRNDQRGLCIPPYFVFQFRADGHPEPRQ
jgi:hypothetical protein